MKSRYAYEEWYETHRFESFSLEKPFGLLKNSYLEESIPDAVFRAADEIYHWCDIKMGEVDELLEATKWPRFAETGEPVRISDTVYSLRGPMEVERVEVNQGGFTLWGTSDGEPYIIDQGTAGSRVAGTYELAQEFYGEGAGE